MTAEIITIGDEILIGQIVDTNSQWIGKQLNAIGVTVHQISSIQDEKEHILNALEEARHRADIVIVTGGLGPTKDDITKQTLAAYFEDTEVVEYPEVLESIKTLFQKIGHPFTSVNTYQAQLPSKATLLPNRYGTAPGMWFYEYDTVFVSLPGVPYEMKGLMQHEVLPRLRKTFHLPYILHKTVMTYGQGESVIAERIDAWEQRLPQHIKLAYLPSFGKVRLRLSGKSMDKPLLAAQLSSALAELFELIPDIITGMEENGSIEEQVGQLLARHKKTVGTAESLTGGKIAASLVSVPGASRYFKGGFVTYTAETKQAMLGVDAQTIANHSVVSREVAGEMSQGALQKLQTDYAIAVTGNAGPTTDHNDKDVGIVYISLASKEGVITEKFDFGQPREKVIQRTVNKALELLKLEIEKK